MSKTSRIRKQRIIEPLDYLQQILEQNEHLTDSGRTRAIDLLVSLALWTSHMNDEDKDYYDCACYAVENNQRWDIDD